LSGIAVSIKDVSLARGYLLGTGSSASTRARGPAAPAATQGHRRPDHQPGPAGLQAPARGAAPLSRACRLGRRHGSAVGECARLRWDAVDLVGGVIRVVRVAEEVSGHVVLKPYPKSKAGRRSVPLPPFAVQALTEHAKAHEVGDDDLIFVARTGAALKRGTFRARVWKPSLQRAGLPMGLRFHDLRHSYATWLVSDGVPINDVAKVMGHEQTSTTLDGYTHSTSERDGRVLRSFAAFSLPQDDDDRS
jgi:integrase